MSEKVVVPVEDLVKTAIKEAMAKRIGAEKADVTSIVADDIIPVIGVAKTMMEVIEVLEPTEGQMLASDLFKGTFIFPGNTDFLVKVFKEDHFDERIRGFIPKVDLSYVLNKPHVCNILKAWENDEKVLIYGPTGSGKSSLLSQLCAWTHRPFIRVNMTGDVDSSHFFGNLIAKDGSTYWVDGVATEAVRYGAVFGWDEWDVTPPEIAMGMQWLLEDEGKLFVKEMPGTSKDKLITPHTDFKLVALGNTQGQGDDTGSHSGTNVQNTATLDRLLTTIKMDYLVESVEAKMLVTKYPKRTLDEAKNLVKFATAIRQGHKESQLALTISPRALLSIFKKMTVGYTLTEAIDLVYHNKLTETHQKVAKELFRKIYGTMK